MISCCGYASRTGRDHRRRLRRRDRLFVGKLGFDLVTDEPALTTDGQPKRWVVVRPPNATTALLLARADGNAQQRAVAAELTPGGSGFSCASTTSRRPTSGCVVAGWSSSPSHGMNHTVELPYSSTFLREPLGSPWPALTAAFQANPSTTAAPSSLRCIAEAIGASE